MPPARVEPPPGNAEEAGTQELGGSGQPAIPSRVYMVPLVPDAGTTVGMGPATLVPQDAAKVQWGLWFKCLGDAQGTWWLSRLSTISLWLKS